MSFAGTVFVAILLVTCARGNSFEQVVRTIHIFVATPKIAGFALDVNVGSYQFPCSPETLGFSLTCGGRIDQKFFSSPQSTPPSEADSKLLDEYMLRPEA